VDLTAPESRTVIHNAFVMGVCNLLTSSNPPTGKFDIKESCCMEGEGVATVEVGSEVISFDILLLHIKNGSVKSSIHYFCECKTRKECSSQVNSDLKHQLGKFLHDAYNTIDYAAHRHRDNYGFLFISDTPFGMGDNDLTFAYLKKILSDIPLLDEEKLNKIMTKTHIMILSEWFIGHYTVV
jgi:hypothetical protein